MSDPLRYPWQQAIADALAANPEALPLKINLAEKAIAVRQKEMPQPDRAERLAITEALRCLRTLIDETLLTSPRRTGGTHFHIRCAGGALDWERFDTTSQAETNAQELARCGETYTLEEHGEDCPRCRALTGQRATTA